MAEKRALSIHFTDGNLHLIFLNNRVTILKFVRKGANYDNT